LPLLTSNVLQKLAAHKIEVVINNNVVKFVLLDSTTLILLT